MNKKIYTGHVLRNLNGMFVVLRTYRGHVTERHEVSESFKIVDATVFQRYIPPNEKKAIDSAFPGTEAVPVRVTMEIEIARAEGSAE